MQQPYHMTLAHQAVFRATQSIGVKEEKPNYGRWVSVYLKFVGIFFPAPWCSAFTSFKIHQAAADIGIKCLWPKQAYVQSVVNWAKKHSNIYDYPRVNDCFVVYNDQLKRYAHIGFIAEVRNRNGIQEFRTVEGNSNTTGSREGTSVVSIWRKWDSSRHKSIKIV